jgi:HEPN domain-containing protein
MSKSRITTPFDEAIFWMDQSLAYFESSKILSDSPSEYKSMPIITLQSFSVECSLKVLLLLACGKYPQKHDSLNLFELLPKDLQDNLVDQCLSEFDIDLKKALDEIRSDFIGSRYHFEDFKTSYVGRMFSIGYLEAVAEFLISYIRTHGDEISYHYGHSSSVTSSRGVTLFTTLKP